MSNNLLILEKGTQIGMMFKEFYTTKNKEKKIRLRGYIFLGIINSNAVGLEIVAYEDENSSNIWEEDNQKIWRIKRKKKSTNKWVTIGFLIKKEKRNKSGKYWHYFYGKISLEGIEIRINLYPFFDQHITLVKNGKESKKRPDYCIELASMIKCSLIELD